MWQKMIEKFYPAEALEPAAIKNLYFRSERFFYQGAVDHNKKGRGRDGWYFLLRGDQARGPYIDRETAEAELNELIERYKEIGFTARD